MTSGFKAKSHKMFLSPFLVVHRSSWARNLPRIGPCSCFRSGPPGKLYVPQVLRCFFALPLGSFLVSVPLTFIALPVVQDMRPVSR